MGSEVMQLRQQLDEICAAMYRGLHGYAAVGKHEHITHKYEMLGEIQEKLARYVGKDRAFQDVIDAISNGDSKKPKPS
jgi:hypothetical protein